MSPITEIKKKNIQKLYLFLERKIVPCNICYEAWPLSVSTKSLKESEYCLSTMQDKKPM